jgi:hypothetical protein
MWEYKVVEINSKASKVESALNEHAREGWELVSSFTSDARGTTMLATLILRRQAQGDTAV